MGRKSLRHEQLECFKYVNESGYQIKGSRGGGVAENVVQEITCIVIVINESKVKGFTVNAKVSLNRNSL